MAATKEEVDKYALNGKKTYIKYNYSTNDNVLYIHAYLKFDKDANEMFNVYDTTNIDGNHKIKNEVATYAELTRQAIEEYWSIDIIGNEYDFYDNCEFKTKVIVHDEGKFGQKFIHVDIGNIDLKERNYRHMNAEASSIIDKKDGSVEYNYTGSRAKVKINAATQEQLAELKDFNHTPLSVNEYKVGIAHEFGHCLGLDDAYDFRDESSKETVLRSYETDETGFFTGATNQWYRNIMFITYTDTRVVGNDIEMAVQAQADAYHKTNHSWQSYLDYEYNFGEYVLNCKQSDVIRKK